MALIPSGHTVVVSAILFIGLSTVGSWGGESLPFTQRPSQERPIAPHLSPEAALPSPVIQLQQRLSVAPEEPSSSLPLVMEDDREVNGPRPERLLALQRRLTRLHALALDE